MGDDILVKKISQGIVVKMTTNFYRVGHAKNIGLANKLGVGHSVPIQVGNGGASRRLSFK